MVSWKSLTSPAPSLDVPGLETVDLADRDMERRIVRKQDIRILPWICVTYLLSKFLLVHITCPAANHVRLPRQGQPRQRPHPQQ